MRYFSDTHFHVMTMLEPNFASFVQSLYTTPQEFLTAGAPQNYIFSPKFLKGSTLLDIISNTLQAFERPIADTFEMMEDDLMGKFTSPMKEKYAPNEPYIRGGKLHFRGKEYDKMIMIPLVMDFSQDKEEREKIYYTFPAEDKITPYAEATIKGMEEYYKRRPEGLFEFYPFLGINPKVHSKEFIKHHLERFVNTTHKMHDVHSVPDKPFYGIKFYPPLNFDPFPDDKEEMEKAELVYTFLEENGVPCTTHTDDQGFRGVEASLAWKYTDPKTWRKVLERHPSLRLDFAHFGQQYAVNANTNFKSIQARLQGDLFSPWFREIISLMFDYPNVYADLSFSGCDREFYVRLFTYLKKLTTEERAHIEDRIMFGSDFSINLLKVESYTQYYSIFETTPFSDYEYEKFLTDNPLKFLSFENLLI